MKRIFLAIFAIGIMVFSSCLSTDIYSDGSSGDGQSSYTRRKSRVLVLDGKDIDIDGVDVIDVDEVGGIASWYCTERYGSSKEVLLEVGYFNSYYKYIGFVLFDGTDTGIFAAYRRDGIDHRWSWGETKRGGYAYSFIIKPDGTGLYYDFSTSEDGTGKPRDFFKTHRR